MSSEIIGIIVFFIFILLVIIFIVITFIALAEEYAKSKKLSKFKQDVLKALNNSKPTWHQIKLIAETQKLTQTDISIVIKQIISDLLIEGNESIKSNLILLESYLESYTNDEPFDDMPDDVRVHLERLKEQLPNRIELLDPIVNHLRDLKIANLRNRRRQKIIEIVSLIVGISGLLIGLYPLFKSQAAN